MDRLRFTLFIALIAGLLCAHTASAQTATTISIVSGNGQITCPLCVSPQRNPRVQPLIVKVTDASGKPVANQEVDWNVTAVTLTTDSVAPTSSLTDANGLAQTMVFEIGQGGGSTFGYLQSNITATLPTNGASVVFTHTQSLTDTNNHSNALIGAAQSSPAQSDPPLRGVAGTPGTTPIVVRVDSFGVGIPNVSIRLIQENATTDTGTISCVTGPGADPGSVLTDSNGQATCTPLFGGSGNGTYNVLVGGVVMDQIFGTGLPIGFRELFSNPFSVTAATPGSIQIVSGNNQSVNQGQAAARLVAKITDASGTAGIAGQTVTWTVTPASAATLSNTVATSDANGLISTDVKLSSTATGTVQVKATLNGSISATFNITSVLNLTLTSIQKVSGDAQTATINTAFAQPVVVQVNSTAGAAVGFPVQFTVSGPATLSAQSANTDNTGKASVNVQAGGTAGTVTVTATASSLSPVTFTLTIVPAGPTLTAASFVNAAGLQPGLSPCGLAIVVGAGLVPNVQGVVLPNAGIGIGANPTTLAGVTIIVNNVKAPILSASNTNGSQRVTFQVPCETAPGASVPVSVNTGTAPVNVNVPVLPASPGIYETPMSDGVQRAVAVRPDGTFVSLENPARRGEIVRAYSTGLGSVAPPAATNALATPGTDALVLGQIIAGVNNAGARVVTARLAPSLIGVYEVAFQIPADTPPGNNIVLSLAINAPGDTQTRFSNGSKIPIQ